MQKDFKINALRTKTKYKLTALRIGMKESILRGLKEGFQGFESIPMGFLCGSNYKCSDGKCSDDDKCNGRSNSHNTNTGNNNDDTSNNKDNTSNKKNGNNRQNNTRRHITVGNNTKEESLILNGSILPIKLPGIKKYKRNDSLNTEDSIVDNKNRLPVVENKNTVKVNLRRSHKQ